MSDEAMDLLLGGAAGPGCKWPTVGTTYEGVITKMTTRHATEFGTKNPKHWPNGDPVIEAVITLQTELREDEVEDDDGVRVLYVDKKNLRVAVANAFRDAGLGRGDSAIGGTLKVRYTGDDTTSQAAQKPKMFIAKFTPGSPAAVMAALDATEVPYDDPDMDVF